MVNRQRKGRIHGNVLGGDVVANNPDQVRTNRTKMSYKVLTSQGPPEKIMCACAKTGIYNSIYTVKAGAIHFWKDNELLYAFQLFERTVFTSSGTMVFINDGDR